MWCIDPHVDWTVLTVAADFLVLCRSSCLDLDQYVANHPFIGIGSGRVRSLPALLAPGLCPSRFKTVNRLLMDGGIVEAVHSTIVFGKCEWRYWSVCDSGTRVESIFVPSVVFDWVLWQVRAFVSRGADASTWFLLSDEVAWSNRWHQTLMVWTLWSFGCGPRIANEELLLQNTCLALTFSSCLVADLAVHGTVWRENSYQIKAVFFPFLFSFFLLFVSLVHIVQ